MSADNYLFSRHEREQALYEQEQERLEDEWYAAQENFDTHYDYEIRTGDAGWISDGAPMG
jgi:hypothetical protein